MKKQQHKVENLHVEKAEADPINRRDFFNKAWKWIGILAALEVTGMFAGFIFSGKSKNTAPPMISVRES